MKEMILRKNNEFKILMSNNYNYIFNKETGFFARWGETKEDDIEYSEFGNEILDIEVTTKCTGPGGKLCSFCYKSNKPNGKNMSLQTFKNVIDKMLPTKNQAGVNQIAFGADATCMSNPELFDMMAYARQKDIVPNITIADITDSTADKLIKYVGAVAVSRYNNKDICYDSIKKLTDRGLTQCNIHIMVSEETYDNVMETLKNYKTDKRLEKLNAIVLLSLKKKGRGTTFNSLSQEKFNKIVEYSFRNNIPIGFDSCSAHKFLEAIKDRKDFKELSESVEPCESGLFSAYVDVNGDFYPCSFSPNTDGWKMGINVENCDNFIEDVWNNKRTISFRNNLIKCKRDCPLYKI